MGAVGKAVARRLRAFDVTILCHDTRQIQQDVLDETAAHAASLDDLLRRSDYVLPLVPLTTDSLHMLNEERIAMMKRGAFLINAGRGSTVDEGAVAAALAKGHLGGYAADVFESEDWARDDRPAGISPALLAMKEKTVFTPHIGSAVSSVRREIEMDAARNIVEALQGHVPHGALTRTIQ
jgi:phosphonate dehydrogenase